MENKKKKIIIISSVALAVVIVAVIICITVFGKNNKETSSDETPTPTTEFTTDEPTTDEPTTAEPTTDEPTTEEPTTAEVETEAPTEVPTEVEKPTIPEELQSKKDYTISWSNPYFFTKKFNNGTEKVYFTYRANLELFGMETTAIGVIPEDARYLLDYEPEYYINGQTDSPDNNNGSISNTEATTENKGNTSGSNNSSSNNPYKDMVGQYVEVDGVVYFVRSDGVLEECFDPGTMTEEEYQKFVKWCQENGITMH